MPSGSAPLSAPDAGAALAVAAAQLAQFEQQRLELRNASLFLSQPDYPALVSVFRTRTMPVDFVMTCNVADYICDELQREGYRTEWAMGIGEAMLTLTPGVDLFVDFGANTGFFALAAAALGIETVAVEPALAPIVQLNRALNGFSPARFELVAAALVDRPGRGDMVQTVPLASMGSATLVDREQAFGVSHLYAPSIKHIDLHLKTTTIDEVLRARVLAPRRPVKLLKIDIEGFEILAWRGGQELLHSGLVQTVVSEFHPLMLNASGCDPLEYLEMFARAGYKVCNWMFTCQPQDYIVDLAAWVRITIEQRLLTDIRFDLIDKPWPPSPLPVVGSGGGAA